MKVAVIAVVTDINYCK